ncbi:MAG: hypothetical protein AAF802_25895 [Planctomycetota bacterium]
MSSQDSSGSRGGQESTDRDVVERLAMVLAHHAGIAVSLQRSASRFFGARRRQCRKLSRFFSKDPSPQRVLKRPDALAICLPFMQDAGTDQPIEKEIDQAVAIGLDQVQRFQTSSGKALILLSYPMIVLVMAITILIGYLVFLVPIFDEMFTEFQLQLNGDTRVVINASRFLCSYWAVLVAIAGISGVGVILILLIERKRDLPVWYGLGGSLVKSKREALAEWARHLAMLSQSGIAIRRAVELAGSSSPNGRIQTVCHRWLSADYLDAPDRSGPLDGEAGCQLISRAIASFSDGRTSQHASVMLLDEAATIQQSRARNHTLQWIGWASPLITFMILSVISVLLVALMSPLVSLISGLSS